MLDSPRGVGSVSRLRALACCAGRGRRHLGMDAVPRSPRGEFSHAAPRCGSTFACVLRRPRRPDLHLRVWLERAASGPGSGRTGIHRCDSTGRTASCTRHGRPGHPDLVAGGAGRTARTRRALPGSGAVAVADRVHQPAGGARRGQLAAAEHGAQGWRARRRGRDRRFHAAGPRAGPVPRNRRHDVPRARLDHRTRRSLRRRPARRARCRAAAAQAGEGRRQPAVDRADDGRDAAAGGTGSRRAQAGAARGRLRAAIRPGDRLCAGAGRDGTCHDDGSHRREERPLDRRDDHDRRACVRRGHPRQRAVR